jgi:hypothetical protein
MAAHAMDRLCECSLSRVGIDRHGIAVLNYDPELLMMREFRIEAVNDI